MSPVALQTKSIRCHFFLHVINLIFDLIFQFFCRLLIDRHNFQLSFSACLCGCMQTAIAKDSLLVWWFSTTTGSHKKMHFEKTSTSVFTRPKLGKYHRFLPLTYEAHMILYFFSFLFFSFFFTFRHALL